MPFSSQRPQIWALRSREWFTECREPRRVKATALAERMGSWEREVTEWELGGRGGPRAGREESGSHAGMNQAMKSGIMTADMCRSPERGPGPDTQHRPSSSQRALGCGCAVMVEETAPATEVTRWTSHSQQVAWPDLDPRASTSRTHSLGHRTPA